MSSVLERFRERKNKPMELFVGYPLDNPVIEFTVRRMPQAVVNNAIIEAEGSLKRQGIQRPSGDLGEKDPAVVEFNAEYYMWLSFHIVEQGREHFIGWKALDGSQLPTFTKASFQDFVSMLLIWERKQLGLAYFQAVAKADEVAEKKESTETAS